MRLFIPHRMKTAICLLIQLWWTLLTDCSPIPQLQIVNGNAAPQDKWKHHVSLQYRPASVYEFGHKCGASLIQMNLVLTAAHCVMDDLTPSNYVILLGEYDTSVESGDEQRILASEIIIHPEFIADPNGYPFDLALIKLSESVVNTSAVEPINLPGDLNETFVGKECWIIGWGKTINTATLLPNLLQEASIAVISNVECILRWAFITITNSHICVYEPFKSACNGDSGGSLVCKNNNDTWVIAGVTSWGVTTCSGEYPGVNTRVSSYISWIQSYFE